MWPSLVVLDDDDINKEIAKLNIVERGFLWLWRLLSWCSQVTSLRQYLSIAWRRLGLDCEGPPVRIQSKLSDHNYCGPRIIPHKGSMPCTVNQSEKITSGSYLFGFESLTWLVFLYLFPSFILTESLRCSQLPFNSAKLLGFL